MFHFNSRINSILVPQVFKLLENEHNNNYISFQIINLNKLIVGYSSYFKFIFNDTNKLLKVEESNLDSNLSIIPEALLYLLNYQILYSLFNNNSKIVLINITTRSNKIFLKIGHEQLINQTQSHFSLMDFYKIYNNLNRNNNIIFELIFLEKLISKFSGTIRISSNENNDIVFETTFPSSNIDLSSSQVFDFSNFIDTIKNDNNKSIFLIPDETLFKHTHSSQLDRFGFSTINSNPLQKKIYSYIKQNISKKIHIQEIAAYLHVSQSTLFRKWKEVSDSSLNDYITRCRLEEVIHLVLTQNQTFATAAYHCGFPNSAYFSRVFKTFYNLTPREYLSIVS
jgi:AraC-like DNA-binding protein